MTERDDQRPLEADPRDADEGREHDADAGWTPQALEDSYLKLLRGLKAGAAGNPDQLGVVRRIATWIASQEVLRVIASEPAWFGQWEVKEALLRNPATPPELRSIPERQIAIFDLLRELDQPGLTEGEKGEIQEDARSLISSLPAADREAVRERAYELSRSRRERAAADPAEGAEREVPPLPEPVFEELSGAELEGLSGEARERQEPVAAPGVEPIPWEDPEPSEGEGEPREEEIRAPEGREAGPAEGPPGASAETADELAAARSSTDPDLLRRLAQGGREEVHRALLENPAVSEAQILALARRAGSRLAADLYHNRRWFHRPAIGQALLENPNAPALAQLATVSALTDLSLLLRAVSGSNVRHLEVKSKARERIRTVFRTYSVGEKVAAVRRHGRRLLSHLWTDFFRDEALVLRCLQERQLDEGTVLEIARSRVAPRRALEKIGSTPAWTARYSIVLALVLNPKTPRQIAQRLLAKLTPADRKRVKNNLSVAESVRRMA